MSNGSHSHLQMDIFSYIKSFGTVEKHFLSCNSRFMVSVNTIKNIFNIWRFFVILTIQKICKKLKYHDGFFSYQKLFSTANPAHLTTLFWSALKGPSWDFNFLCIFEILRQICLYVSIKKVVKFWTYHISLNNAPPWIMSPLE